MEKSKIVERLDIKSSIFYSKKIFTLEIRKENKKYDAKSF